MARGPKILERIRRSKAGVSERDIFSVLEYYGYELVRQVQHGAMYRHPDLARHPELEVRRSLAQVIVPKGSPVKEYVAEQVLASVDALLARQLNDTND